MTNDDLLQNHLTFLSHHRGTVTAGALGYEVASSRPEFTYTIALRDAPIDPRIGVVQRPAFSGLPASALRAAGFRLAGALTYMTRDTTALETPPVPGLVVERARTADAAVFADVQTCGFFDAPAARTEWLPFMRAAAERNLAAAERNLAAAERNLTAAEQAFYIARLDGVPAAVTLAVSTGLVGVYAVATPASFRKRGLATALLATALRDAAAAGHAFATLQVAAGSDAERLYTKAGFAPRFESEIWRHG